MIFGKLAAGLGIALGLSIIGNAVLVDRYAAAKGRAGELEQAQRECVTANESLEATIQSQREELDRASAEAEATRQRHADALARLDERKGEHSSRMQRLREELSELEADGDGGCRVSGDYWRLLGNAVCDQAGCAGQGAGD